MNKIYILTGEVRTGKTTRLMLWATSQKNVDGILQPVIDEKRFIYHIGSKTLKQLEIESSSDTIKIGKYNFSRNVFAWAQNVVTECFQKKIDWLVIDEVGPLELDSIGLEPAISKIIEGRNNFTGNILCVVRNSMLEKFIKHYRLENSSELFNLD